MNPGGGGGGGRGVGVGGGPGRGFVTIDLTGRRDPGSPLGMLLAPASAAGAAPPSESRVTILAGWERMPGDNRMGPVQSTGQARLGDRLVRINNVDVTDMTFGEVMDLLRAMVHGGGGTSAGGAARLRSLGFAHHSARRAAPPPAAGPPDARDRERGGRDLYAFRSSVRRARVRACRPRRREDGAAAAAAASAARGGRRRSASPSSAAGPSVRRGGTAAGGGGGAAAAARVEYEIACRLSARYAGGSLRIGGAGEERTWSVWKRYSEFKELDEALRKSYGWHIDALNDGRGLSFPPGHVVSSILVGTMDASFVERRRSELEEYWQSIQKVRDAFDFTNPSSRRFSTDAASFLDIGNHFNRTKSNVPSNCAAHTDPEKGACYDALDGPNGASLRPVPSDPELSVPSCRNEQNGAADGGAGAEFVARDIVIDSDSASVSSALQSAASDAPAKRKVRGAAKSAFQRRFLDSP